MPDGQADFISAETLAHAVQAVANMDLVARSYNRFDPTASEWWLIPSSDWPAFRYGKLFFDANPRKMPPGTPEGSIYCGFYVERGLSAAVSEVPGTPLWFSSWIMGPDWLRREFVGEPRYELAAHSREVTLSVWTSSIPVPSRDQDRNEYYRDFYAHKEGYAGGRVCFRLGRELRLERIVTERGGNYELAEYLEQTIGTASDLTVLSSALGRLPDAYHWAWVDLYIGITIRGKSEAKTTAAQLWTEHLAPWKPWLRCAG
jgi:hypothetical protein